ncbi:MAG: RecX family transcriptional regulator, partial [Lachnospiraceae bacterium]|nr:RecX family transcriptional regulator [Lachnospiraceae bacterium]
EELIDRAVGWLEKLHYLDDVRYTENYLRSHGTKKSRLQLQQDLTRRGVDTTTIKDGLAQMDDVDEEALIRRWIEKKKVDPENCSPKERQRLYGFLLRKGFSHAQIGKVMRGLKEDC